MWFIYILVDQYTMKTRFAVENEVVYIAGVYIVIPAKAGIQKTKKWIIGSSPIMTG